MKGDGAGGRAWIGGASRFSSTHVTIGALVPWNRSLACASGSLVRSLVSVLRGGTAREGVAKYVVEYMEAVKGVEGVRVFRKALRCWRLAVKMPSR